MTKYRFSTLAIVSLACVGFMGCGPKPNMESVLAAWKKGDKPTAISRFVAPDWNQRPLFPPDSPLSLRACANSRFLRIMRYEYSML
jgi:hypothetical protein